MPKRESTLHGETGYRSVTRFVCPVAYSKEVTPLRMRILQVEDTCRALPNER